MKALAFPSGNKGKSQKFVLRNVVYIGVENGDYLSLDADSGSVIWRVTIGFIYNAACSDLPQNKFGISGTAFIDLPTLSLFVVSGTGNLHRLLLVSGLSYSSKWPLLSLFDPTILHTYGAVSKLNNTVYITAAGQCDIGIYRGLVYAIDVVSVNITAKFFPVTLPNYQAGIWGMAGLSINLANSALYTATGNAVAMNPISYNENIEFAEHVVKLTTKLKPILSYTPGVLQIDDDFGSTPSVFRPTNKCNRTLLAVENKAGLLIVFDENFQHVQQFQIAKRDSETIATPAFDSIRNLLFVVNPMNSKAFPLGVTAYRIQNNCNLLQEWSVVLRTCRMNYFIFFV